MRMKGEIAAQAANAAASVAVGFHVAVVLEALGAIEALAREERVMTRDAVSALDVIRGRLDAAERVVLP